MTKELEERLASLEEGAELTIKDDDGDEVMYLKPRPPKECEQHEFERISDTEEICPKCGNGRVVTRL